MAARVSRIVQDRGAMRLFGWRSASRVLLVALLAGSMLVHRPAAAQTGSAGAKESAWRATEKWLTYKPVVVAFNFGAIYAWTGSVSAMLVLGTVTAVANTGVFYANNMGWDVYEWWNTPVFPAPVVHADAAPRATATP
jgi:hypothetical protein